MDVQGLGLAAALQLDVVDPSALHSDGHHLDRMSRRFADKHQFDVVGILDPIGKLGWFAFAGRDESPVTTAAENHARRRAGRTAACEARSHDRKRYKDPKRGAITAYLRSSTSVGFIPVRACTALARRLAKKASTSS